ncbi:hypothetical protein BP6252_14070 [Coleophoma cylindrospora]|uniref:DUF5672 domain-containing protein n=1 Tax=Coleophoma cylindrospora TaxID=1849047 RepID=A0A3D8Q4N7_9HELO|nr:hypothetical protein BP6252_14070 [Coleophoma cylindrospora]
MINQYKYSPLVATPAQRRKPGIVAVALVTLIVIYIIKFTIPKSSSVNYLGDNSTVTPLITTKVATIIEDRPLDTLVPLLLHFSSVLGSEWPIILYTSQDMLPASYPFQRAINENRIIIRTLPSEVHFRTQESVSDFLTQPWLWEQLAPAEHVLLFQADSILCSNSALQVDDFFEYDFIGAPINPSYGKGYNGGLSLRNRTMILDILGSSSWKDEKDDAENPTNPGVEFEDQWFYNKMVERGAVLPSLEVAQTFAVETIFYDTPLAYHQVERWQKDNMQKIDRWCPEHRLASKDLIISH